LITSTAFLNYFGGFTDNLFEVVVARITTEKSAVRTLIRNGDLEMSVQYRSIDKNQLVEIWVMHPSSKYGIFG